MVQQCTKSASSACYNYTDKTYYNTESLVPIQAYIRQLQQLLSQQDWDNEVNKAQATYAELARVISYQEQSGSLYYPLF